MSADVSERALRELYLRAFRAAVEEADVRVADIGVQSGQGTYMSEHEYLLTEVVKGQWGFEGVVISDW